MTRRLLTAFLLLFPMPAAVLAQAKADAKGGTTFETEGAFIGHNYEVRLKGTTDLPEGTVLKVICRRVEKGKAAAQEAQMVAAVKGGKLEAIWNFPRVSFRPGTFAFEITLHDEQPDTVAAALTPKQRDLRLKASLDTGVERPSVLVALEACRTAVSALRALPANANDLAQHAAAAAEGKLDKKAWAACKAKVDPPLALAEKTLARREIPFYLPSTTTLWPMITRARAAMKACEAGADGTPSLDAQTAAFPADSDVTAALRPLRLDAITVWANAADDVLRNYVIQDISNVRTVRPLTPEQQGQVRAQAELFTTTWPQLRALAWKGELAADIEPLMEELFRDMKALPAAKFNAPAGAAPAPEKKDRKDGPGSFPIETLVTQMHNNLVKLRVLLEQEKAKKP